MEPGARAAEPVRRRVVNALWTAAGTVFLGLGIIGIGLPLLPTTPFLLLAAACYLRGSRKMHAWMLGNRVFGSYLRNYTEGRGIPLRVKVATIALLWAVIGSSAILATEEVLVRALLLAIAVVVTIHIAGIRAKAETRSPGTATGTRKSDSSPEESGPVA